MQKSSISGLQRSKTQANILPVSTKIYKSNYQNEQFEVKTWKYQTPVTLQQSLVKIGNFTDRKLLDYDKNLNNNDLTPDKNPYQSLRPTCNSENCQNLFEEYLRLISLNNDYLTQIKLLKNQTEKEVTLYKVGLQEKFQQENAKFRKSCFAPPL